MNMIKQATPFVPLADKTGLNARHANIPSKYDTQKKFESEYVHPILGKLNPTIQNWVMGKAVKTQSEFDVPMKEVYDKITQAQDFTHTDITRDPNYINKLNSYRSSPNSQLEPIPESISFSYWPGVPGYDQPSYYPMIRTVYSSPFSQAMINGVRRPLIGDVNGLYDYFHNYNYFDQNKYNNTQTNVIEHEAIGHGGNQAKSKSEFYKPIAEREGKSVEEIVPIDKKFTPTYWNNEMADGNGIDEFTQSLHAVKRQGREWGYPVDSDNDEEVTQAFRDTINRIQKMPLEQARQLPMESQRFRSYLNNTRQYNSYKENPDSNGFMNRMRKIYNNFKSFHPEDQNNPQLMDKTTEDVLYYTTPETLKGLLARKNNAQLNKQAACKTDKNINLIKLAKEYSDIPDTNLLKADNIQSETLKGAYTDKEIAAMSPKEKEELAALDYRLFDEENNTFSDSAINDLSNWIGLGGGLAAGTAAYNATGNRAAAAIAALGTGIGGGYLAQYLTKKIMNAGRPDYKKYEEYSFPGVSLVF